MKSPMRQRIQRCLRDAEAPLTAPEIARRMGNDVVAVRPRISEMVRDSLIEDSGDRGRSEQGFPLKKWRLPKADAEPRQGETT